MSRSPGVLSLSSIDSGPGLKWREACGFGSKV